MNIQDLFLNQLRKERLSVVVECHNGEKHTGFVKGFDNFCVFMQTSDGPCLLYKHAMAKILPPKDFVLKVPDRETVPRKF